MTRDPHVVIARRENVPHSYIHGPYPEGEAHSEASQLRRLLGDDWTIEVAPIEPGPIPHGEYAPGN